MEVLSDGTEIKSESVDEATRIKKLRARERYSQMTSEKKEELLKKKREYAKRRSYELARRRHFELTSEEKGTKRTAARKRYNEMTCEEEEAALEKKREAIREKCRKLIRERIALIFERRREARKASVMQNGESKAGDLAKIEGQNKIKENGLHRLPHNARSTTSGRIYRCYARGCHATSVCNDTRFFFFPPDPMHSQEWARRIGKPCSLETAEFLGCRMVLCSLHFNDDQFTTSERQYLKFSVALPTEITVDKSEPSSAPSTCSVTPAFVNVEGIKAVFKKSCNFSVTLPMQRCAQKSVSYSLPEKVVSVNSRSPPSLVYFGEIPAAVGGATRHDNNRREPQNSGQVQNGERSKVSDVQNLTAQDCKNRSKKRWCKYKCFAVGCSTSSQSNCGQFFFFPKNNSRSQEWLKRVGRPCSLEMAQKVSRTTTVLCSKHFTDDQFGMGERKCDTGERRRLSKTALPSEVHVVTTKPSDVTTLAVPSGSDVTTLALPSGSNVTTLAVPLGSDVTTSAVSSGSNVTTLAVPLGSDVTTLAVPSGSDVTTLALPSGSNVTTLAVPLGSDVTTSAVSSGSDVTTLAVPSGSDVTTLAVPSGSDVTTLAVPSGSNVITLVVPSVSHVTTLAVPSGSDVTTVATTSDVPSESSEICTSTNNLMVMQPMQTYMSKYKSNPSPEELASCTLDLPSASSGLSMISSSLIHCDEVSSEVEVTSYPDNQLTVLKPGPHLQSNSFYEIKGELWNPFATSFQEPEMENIVYVNTVEEPVCISTVETVLGNGKESLLMGAHINEVQSSSLLVNTESEDSPAIIETEVKDEFVKEYDMTMETVLPFHKL